MSVIVTCCENGDLLNGVHDEFFRYHDHEVTGVLESGDVESTTGHFALLELTEDVLAEFYNSSDHFYIGLHNRLEPGWYIDVRGSDGTIWAFDFHGTGTLAEEAARAALRRARGSLCRVVQSRYV